MAKELKILKVHTTGLYDSDTGRTLKAKKVVNVTDDCPNASKSDRCIFLYCKSKRGRIIQIIRPYKEEKFMGVSIHFFVDELDEEMNRAERDDTFGSWANQLGLTKSELRLLIRTHAPAK